MPSGNKALITASSDGGARSATPFLLAGGRPPGSYEGRPASTAKGVVHVHLRGRGRAVSRAPGAAGTAAADPAVLYRSSADHGRTWSDSKQIEEGNSASATTASGGCGPTRNSDNLYAVCYGHTNPAAAVPRTTATSNFVCRTIGLEVGGPGGGQRRLRVAERAAHAPQPVRRPNGRLDIVWMDTTTAPSRGHHDPAAERSSTSATRTSTTRTRRPGAHVSPRHQDHRPDHRPALRHLAGQRRHPGPTGILLDRRGRLLHWQDSATATARLGRRHYFASLRMPGRSGRRHPGRRRRGRAEWLLHRAGLAIGMAWP